MVELDGEDERSERVSEGLTLMVLNSSPLRLLLVRVSGTPAPLTVRSSKASNSLPSPHIFRDLRFLGLVSSFAEDGIATRAAGMEMLGGRILDGFDLAKEEAVGAVSLDCEKLKVDLALRRLGCLVDWLVCLEGERGREEREPLLCIDLMGGAGVTLAGAEDLGFLFEALCNKLFCILVGDSFISCDISKSCSNGSNWCLLRF